MSMHNFLCGSATWKDNDMLMYVNLYNVLAIEQI